jgi:L-fuconolactonase
MNNPAQTSSASIPSASTLGRRVDAHHHLWRYSPTEFQWIGEDMAELRRDFLMDDLRALLETATVDATVVVQARETLEETQWLLDCARSTSIIRGVVGWAPLEDDRLPEILDGLANAGTLVGLRKIVQGQPAGVLDGAAFNRGIDHLTRLDLTYDILIYEQQLIEAIRFVDRHPSQRFVLDHAAKPKISKCELEPWRTNLRELGRRPNVFCKVSGLVTEAKWHSWTLESLRPYLDACVEAFGPDRLLAGSDWPVCLVATGYSQWWNLLAKYFENFGGDEIRRIFGETTIDVYRLSPGTEVQS